MNPKSPDIDDRRVLIRAVCHQDRRALSVLYLKYHRQIESFIASRINYVVDTEDLAQEVFIQLCSGKCSYTRHTDVKSYLFGIARNVIKRYHRRRRKVKSSETVFIHSTNPTCAGCDIRQHQDSEKKIMLKQLKIIIKDAMNQLHSKERQAVRMRILEGLSTQEAAKKAGCSIGAFYKRLERAERNLRKAGRKKD